MKSSQATRVLSASLAAAALGAGIAILTAPRSGRETRTRLRLRAMQAKFRAKRTANATKDRLQQQIDKGKQIKDSIAKSYQKTKSEINDKSAESAK